MIEAFIGKKVAVKTALSAAWGENLRSDGGMPSITYGTLLEVDEDFIKLEVVGTKGKTISIFSKKYVISISIQ